MRALPFLVIYLLLVPHKAEAYLDPGSGSLVFQVVIAFFVGIAFAMKQHWVRFKGIFRKRSRVKPGMTNVGAEASDTKESRTDA